MYNSTIVSYVTIMLIVDDAFIVLGSNPFALIGCYIYHSCKCDRYGPKIQFWLRHLLQLPPLIYRESSCHVCLSKNYSLPHFLSLRRDDDDDDGMDSCYRSSYIRTVQ
jgi:hypothetical protein